jgi:hypothetical protein
VHVIDAAAAGSDFAALIGRGPDDTAFERLRRAESIGRPLGDRAFLRRLERATRRPLAPGKRGPKPSLRDAARQRELPGLRS